MNVEEVLLFIDASIFAKMGKHLSDLQRLLIQAAWSGSRQGYDQIAQANGYSPNYLKQDAGPKLWQLLSDVFGEKIKKSNFRAAIERQAGLLSHISSPTVTLPVSLDTTALLGLQQESANFFAAQQRKDEGGIIHNSQRFQDWGAAPDISIFYDRSNELAQLEQWIVTERCRLVGLVGMGGIGKTHLSVKLAERIQEQFDYVIWRSLHNAPPLQEILTSLLQFIINTQETDLPATVDEKLSHLIDCLRKYRCLLILDNAETILRHGDCAGIYKQGYEDYGDFFKLLGECRHESCLVLTSREKLKEIVLMQGETLPVRCLNLRGLSVSAGQMLLQLKGCHWKSEAECRVLVEKYSGNPLALKIVAAAIQELFEGSITEFLKYKTFVFNEIRALLEQQINRLPDLGNTILYWLVINRQPVSVAELQSDIYPNVSQQTLIETLKSLIQRSLIEKKATHFLLQPLLMEYVTNLLIERVCQEIETGELVLLNSHALLKAQAKEYIRKTQISFIIQPIIDRLITVFKTKSHLEIRLGQIISKLRSQSPDESGYAAGNILNLLCQLETNLSGYDFSQLKVWQAYLQDVNLHEVNFTGADLAKSVFAQQMAKILSVAFSPDGRMLATGDANGEIRLWQVADSKLLLVCKGHTGWVQSVAFSPDGRMLSSGSSDQTIKLWDVSDGGCRKTLLGHNQRVRSVAFNPDGTILCSGGNDWMVRLWDVESGECLKIFSGHTSYIWSVAFSPDGMTLASGSDDRTVKLWDLGTSECWKTLSGHTHWVRTVAFSPDGKTLASGSGDGTIKLWDLPDGIEVKILEGHNQRLRALAFSPDGSTLASGSGDHTVKLWDVSEGKCLKTLHGHSSRLTSLAFSPDGTILASGGEDQAVRCWEVNTGQCVKTWQGYASGIQSVAFSPNGTILASGNEDWTVKLWDVQGAGDWGQRGQGDKGTRGQGGEGGEGGQGGFGNASPSPHLPIAPSAKSSQSSIPKPLGEGSAVTLQGHTSWVCSVAFSPDGTMLASASSDQTLKLWDVSQGRCLKTLLGHTRWVSSVAFSPDGTTLVSCGGDNTLRLWDVLTGKCVKICQGHSGWLWSVAFSPDGVTVASASEDKTVKLWDIRTGECVKTFVGHTSWVLSVAFSPDGKTLASGSCDQSVRLWDLGTGECVKTFWGHISWVQSVTFSPDGKTLASGSCDQTMKLWDLGTGKCWQTLSAHASWIWSVAFSPISLSPPSQGGRGGILASGGQDETIKLWDVNVGKCLGTLRSRRPYEGMRLTEARGLTEAQLATLKGLGAVEEIE
ncbi:MAG: NACHT domain-containing protein [Stigonema ocellatum SAG 48.90 = DSM 106950]|nr:NACHT domain-containing protein [Stigonema ocellatum SAG 48.90 = DSM 106950]